MSLNRTAARESSRLGRVARLAFCVGLAGALTTTAPLAAPPRKAAPAKKAGPKKAGPKKAGPKKAGPKKAGPKKAGRTSEGRAGDGKGAPRKLEKAAAESSKAASKVKQKKTTSEGVTTYEFKAMEVEGRLKSPQILFFLRRVRASFQPRGLGHRSFLRELRHTRTRQELK